MRDGFFDVSHSLLTFCFVPVNITPRMFYTQKFRKFFPFFIIFKFTYEKPFLSVLVEEIFRLPVV